MNVGEKNRGDTKKSSAIPKNRHISGAGQTYSDEGGGKRFELIRTAFQQKGGGGGEGTQKGRSGKRLKKKRVQPAHERRVAPKRKPWEEKETVWGLKKGRHGEGEKRNSTEKGPTLLEEISKTKKRGEKSGTVLPRPTVGTILCGAKTVGGVLFQH